MQVIHESGRGLITALDDCTYVIGGRIFYFEPGDLDLSKPEAVAYLLKSAREIGTEGTSLHAACGKADVCWVHGPTKHRGVMIDGHRTRELPYGSRQLAEARLSGTEAVIAPPQAVHESADGRIKVLDHCTYVICGRLFYFEPGVLDLSDPEVVEGLIGTAEDMNWADAHPGEAPGPDEVCEFWRNPDGGLVVSGMCVYELPYGSRQMAEGVVANA